MAILLIDSFDSFTYNISQIFESLNQKVLVVRNNLITTSLIQRFNPDRIVISPGPGSPIDAIISLKILKDYHKKIPILGICLGHQVIAHYFGCNVCKAPKPMHGKKVMISNDSKIIFNSMPPKIAVGLYNSLIVDNKKIPEELTVTSLTEDKLIMGLRHKVYPIESVQFHPDSILTPLGKKMLNNWITHEY